jgi:hypothetical protein
MNLVVLLKYLSLGFFNVRTTIINRLLHNELGTIEKHSFIQSAMGLHEGSLKLKFSKWSLNLFF